jgi:hypothetical protein
MLGDKCLIEWERAYRVGINSDGTKRENFFFWSLVQWTFLGSSLITSIIAFYFLTEQPPVHNGGLEFCVLLGVSFLSLLVS